MPLCIWKNPNAENLQVFLIGVESKKTTIDLRIDVHGFFLRVAFLLPKRGRLAFMVGHKLCQPKNASRIRKWRRTYPASKRISYAYINMHIYIYMHTTCRLWTLFFCFRWRLETAATLCWWSSKVFVPSKTLKTSMCVHGSGFSAAKPIKVQWAFGCLRYNRRIQNAGTHSENHQEILFRFCLMDLKRRFAWP